MHRGNAHLSTLTAPARIVLRGRSARDSELYVEQTAKISRRALAPGPGLHELQPCRVVLADLQRIVVSRDTGCQNRPP
jgi:hypothetical protein